MDIPDTKPDLKNIVVELEQILQDIILENKNFDSKLMEASFESQKLRSGLPYIKLRNYYWEYGEQINNKLIPYLNLNIISVDLRIREISDQVQIIFDNTRILEISISEYSLKNLKN